MVWWAKTGCPDAPGKISKVFTGGSPRPLPRSSETGADGLERVAGGTNAGRESRLRRGSRGDLPVHGRVPGTAPNRHHGPHARSLAERLLRLEESSPKLPRPGGRASQAGDPQRPRLPSRRIRRASNPRGTAGAGMAGGAQAGCPTDAGTWNRRSFGSRALSPKGLGSAVSQTARRRPRKTRPGTGAPGRNPHDRIRPHTPPIMKVQFPGWRRSRRPRHRAERRAGKGTPTSGRHQGRAVRKGGAGPERQPNVSSLGGVRPPSELPGASRRQSKLPCALRRAAASSDWSLPFCERGAVAPLSHFPPDHAGGEPEVRRHCFCTLG